MKQQLIDFLKSLGFTASQIAAMKPLMEKDEVEAADVTAIATIKTEVQATLTGLIVADTNNVKTIRDAERGRVKNEVETLVKKVFALSPEEMEGKKMEDVIVFAHQKIAETAGKDKKDLLAETVKQANEIKELKEIEIPKIRAEVDAKLMAVEDDNLLIAELSDTEKRKIAGKPKLIAPSVIAYLESQGIARKRVEGGGFEFINKTTGLQVKSKDGTKLLDNDGVLDWALDEMGLKINSDGDPKKDAVIIPKNEDKTDDINHNLGFDEADANLKRLAADALKSKK